MTRHRLHLFEHGEAVPGAPVRDVPTRFFLTE